MIDETTTCESGYEIAEFTITFSYSAQGQTYFDTYKAGSPEEDGHIFEILFAPSNPQRNSASDAQIKSPLRILRWFVGGAVALLLIWLSRNITN
ncbi:MAG: hypothetical protein WDN23_06965 [Edaphobacter sp.]